MSGEVVEANSYGDLFAEDSRFEEVSEDTSQETTEDPEVESESEEVEEEKPSPDEGETDKEGETSEEQTQDTPVVVAKIEIDGKEFEFDEPKIQRLAEQYIEVASQNKELLKHREVVEEAMGYINNIRAGQDIDEAMLALGVDFDKLIMDRVKEFIRRSTLSQKEREAEDLRRENEKLRKLKEEREAKEAALAQEQEGKKHAEEIFSNVTYAVSKIPEKFQQEVRIELLTQIEKKIRSGGVRPSAKAIANAASIIYERKKKLLEPEPKKVTNLPKPVQKSATPPVAGTKKKYNAVDYNELFKRG